VSRRAAGEKGKVASGEKEKETVLFSKLALPGLALRFQLAENGYEWCKCGLYWAK
jgi:hypothetical protein